jgi:hypothetical protein
MALRPIVRDACGRTLIRSKRTTADLERIWMPIIKTVELLAGVELNGPEVLEFISMIEQLSRGLANKCGAEMADGVFLVLDRVVSTSIKATDQTVLASA